MADNLFMKKLAGLPVWAWGLIGVAGVGIGFYFIHKPASGIPTGTQASDTSSGNVLPDTYPQALQPSNETVGPGDPFMSVPVGSGTVPVLPNGYNPIYDTNGNLTGYQAPPAPPSAQNPNPAGSPGVPLIPQGKYSGPNYLNKAPGAIFAKYTYGGTNYTLKAGQNGRLWGSRDGTFNDQVLLYQG